MNDKQKLALNELADVMGKHNITIEGLGDSPIYVWAQFGAAVIESYGDALNHKYIKKVLIDAE